MGKFYDRVLGSPLVYDCVRPALLGGFDFSAVYRDLGSDASSVIVDVGCGTGAALTYLDQFTGYHGFDIDQRALQFARKRFGGRANVSFYERTLLPADVSSLRPTRAVLMGVLHHLSSGDVHELFATLALSDRIERVVTLDPVRVPGRWMNNLLCELDRGSHVRTESGYRDLVSTTPFRVEATRSVRSGNRMAWYFATTLVRSA